MPHWALVCQIFSSSAGTTSTSLITLQLISQLSIVTLTFGSVIEKKSPLKSRLTETKNVETINLIYTYGTTNQDAYKTNNYYCPFQDTYRFLVPVTYYHTSEPSIAPIDEILRVFAVKDIPPVTVILKVLTKGQSHSH